MTFLKTFGATLSLSALLALGTSLSGPLGAALAQERGGTLAIVEPAPFATAQPSSRANIQVVNARYQLVDQLIHLDPQTGLPQPWLAESWSISEDGLTYEFRLREGVTHSDGTPVDAENVKRNLDQFAFGNEARRLPRYTRLSAISAVEVVDPLTVRLTLSRPNGNLLDYLAMPDNGIHANAYLDLDLEGQSTFANLIASGPFTVESYRENEQLTLVRREGYAWPYEGAENQGEAYVDRVIFRFAPDATARAGLVASGQADLARAITPIDEEFLRSSGAQVLTANPLTGGAAVFYFHPSNPIVSDLTLRRALLLGYDREALIRDGLTESYTPATSFIPAGAFGHVETLPADSFDPVAAERLLDEAGWTRGADGVREKDGQRLRLTIAVAPSSVGSTTGRRYFELLAQQYLEIGVELDLTYVGSPTHWAETQRDISLPLSALRTPYGPIEGIQAAFNDYLALGGADAELESLLQAAFEAFEEAPRRAALEAVQRYLIEQAYILPLYDDPQTYAGSARLRNASFNAYGHPNLAQVWVE